MTSRKNIDVVILSLNRVKDTVDAIDNVLSQIGVNVFVWLVDQGSERDCIDALRRSTIRYKNIAFHELGKNYGVPGGRNRGIAFGESETVVCIDNDAVFKDEKCLLHVSELFYAQQNLGVLGFRIENYFTNDVNRSDWVYPRLLMNRSSEPFLATRFCGAGHALRRSAFEKVGGYDETLFFYWEELDLSYKIINEGLNVAYDPAITILHKKNPEARVRWQDQRYYYLVRNALYIDWKYFRSFRRLSFLAAGYFIKGVYNQLTRQALTGIKDGISLSAQFATSAPQLNQEALRYVQENDAQYRGGLLNRIRQEVFEKLVSM